ncbi:MAG: hypothetical protein VX910_00250 [Candidatus Latescibacterota bacterium]|nr:hypothetical protein [Candidatus Latescibacterota bacterium]
MEYKERRRSIPNGENPDVAVGPVDDFLNNLVPDVGERVLVVDHCITFAATMWVLCKNPADTFKQMILKRGHLAVTERRSNGLHLVQMPAVP